MKLLVGLFLVTSIPAFANAPKHTGELLYQVKESFLKTSELPEIQVYRPHTKADIADIKQKMIDSGKYEFVEYNTIETNDLRDTGEIDLKNDPNFNTQWQHRKIETLRAWDTTQGLNETLVAVCDSGVEKNHEDLKGRVLDKGWDFVDRDSDANPVTSHGTFVAGLIAATADNALGGAGVAPEVKILPLRITDENGSTSMRTITDCIRYAANAGARVINVSFTGVQSSSVESAGKYARRKGALLVYSAGNQGQNRSSWPDHKNVLAVGATNSYDNRWTYRTSDNKIGGSNYGYFVDLVAPGHNMFSTTTYLTHNQGSAPYRRGSGTSYSAPIASAVAALIFSVNPSLTPDEVEEIMINSCDKIGDQYYFGAGRVNAYQAVKLALKTL